MYKNGFKRIIDFTLVLFVLFVIWPFLLIMGIWLHFANKGAGVFFFQERVTKVGKLVRSTSIDELPQLINVLKGDMALIGPRPLLVRYLSLYSKEQARRHEVRPGITGWAQVNGRNAISWTKKFEFDVWYVDHCSFWLDLCIILKTIKKVFVREGISQQGQATMEPFNGNN